MARLKQSEAFPLVTRVLEGKMDREEFYEITGLRPGGYEYWSRRYRDSEGKNGSFVPVGSIVDDEGELEIRMASRVQIRFSKIVPAKYLLELVRGL